MEQENWINEVLNSTKGMQKAEPGPFLFEKIARRIEREKIRPVKVPTLQWALAAAAIIIITINIISISASPRISNSGTEANNNISELAREMGYKTNYNY